MKVSYKYKLHLKASIMHVKPPPIYEVYFREEMYFHNLFIAEETLRDVEQIWMRKGAGKFHAYIETVPVITVDS